MRLPLVLLAVLLVGGCGTSGSVSPVTRTDTASAQPTWTTGTTIVPEADREAAPPISGTTLTGVDLSLASMTGRVIVLNAWASWCAPCRDEAPALAAVARSRPDVAFVGLDVSDDAARARQFAAEVGMDYPSIVDRSGALLATIPGVPPAALPSTVVIDSKGRIAARIIGPTTQQALESVLDEIS